MNPYAMKKPERRNWYATLIRKQGSKRLYIRITYFGQIICRTTGLPDTEENRTMLEPVIDKMNREIATGEFQFAKAFPGAPEAERRHFTQLEGKTFRPQPSEVTFGRAFAAWKEKAYPNLPVGPQRDNLNPLTSRIVPYFGHWPCDKITPEEVRTFFRLLAQPDEPTRDFFATAEGIGRVKLEPLSDKRLRTILGAFRRVWDFACAEYQWGLPSPFEKVNRYITEVAGTQEVQVNVEKLSDEELTKLLTSMEESVEDPTVEVLLLSEIQAIIAHLPPLLRPPAELQLHGMIASEIGALKNAPIKGDYLIPRLSLSRGHLRNRLKTRQRVRLIPLTRTLRRVLDQSLAQAKGPLLFRGLEGGYFNEKVFREPWYRACDAAGVKRVRPYALRHTFVANCEVMGIPKYRIIGLTGHADKSMVDRVYGKYREGIEREATAIRAYYGEDFVAWKNDAATPSNEGIAAS